ncbi:MAG: hypothetical protein AAGD05_15050, partial [Bacteroidota bacterium]
MRTLITCLFGLLCWASLAVAQDHPATHFECHVASTPTALPKDHSKQQHSLPESCGSGYQANEIKLQRVNVHYMLTTDPNNPENFTETDDGKGNSNYTGYDFANDIIRDANDGWSKNYAMTLYDPPFPALPPEVKQKGIRLLLYSVYFHRNDAIYYSFKHSNGACDGQLDLVNNFGEDIGSAINMFIMEDRYLTLAFLQLDNLEACRSQLRNISNR